MSKASSSNHSIIDPAKVRWKYFSLDENGEVIPADEKPEDLPALAILAVSLWPSGQPLSRRNTPARIKGIIQNTLNQDLDGRKPRLCVAVPCAPIEEMVEYYGAENFEKMKSAGIEEEYISVQMHDDLRKGATNFITSDLEISGSMPAKEGAEQIASAIENGFDIWSVVGGHSLFPKLQLCEKYFAAKAQLQTSEVQTNIPQKRSHFIGMSDGSCSQFYLRGLINPINYFGIVTTLSSDVEIKKSLFRAVEGEENIEFERSLIPENIEEVKNRYDALMKEGDEITNLSFFPRQLAFSFDSTFPKFKENEKIILSLEGFIQSSSGYNAHEVLYRALKTGAIDKDKVLYISIEDIIRKSEQVAIERFGGLIPDFEKLNAGDKTQVNRLASAMEISVEEYIQKSNAATLAEIARIKEVAQKFEIPVVECPGRRVGHASNPVAQSTKVKEVRFNEDGTISQISTLERGQRSELFSDVRRDANADKLPWAELELSSILGEGEVKFCLDEDYEYEKITDPESDNIESAAEVKKMKLLQLNSAPYVSDIEERVICGNSLNIAEMKPSDLAGKRIIAHLSFKGTSKGTNPVTDAYQIINSESLMAAKFVVLSLTTPENFSEEEKKEYLENRNNVFRKLFADFQIDKPVFITTNSPDQKKLRPIFEANIDLAKALAPSLASNPRSEVAQLIATEREAQIGGK